MVNNLQKQQRQGMDERAIATRIHHARSPGVGLTQGKNDKEAMPGPQHPGTPQGTVAQSYFPVAPLEPVLPALPLEPGVLAPAGCPLGPAPVFPVDVLMPVVWPCL